MKRTDPNLTDKLCSMIILHFGIPHDVAKGMNRKQILSLMVWDHAPVAVATAVAIGWTPDQYNHPSNIVGLLALAPDHDVKTATIDIPQIAKDDRIAAAQAEFRARILAKSGQADAAPAPKSKWGTRKLQSRGFQRSEKSNAARSRRTR